MHVSGLEYLVGRRVSVNLASIIPSHKCTLYGLISSGIIFNNSVSYVVDFDSSFITPSKKIRIYG